MMPCTVRGRRRCAVVVLVLVLGGLSGCASSSSEPTPAKVAETVSNAPVTPPSSRVASADPVVVVVAFDSPGADPRPLREVSVPLATPTKVLRMRVIDLTYRGVVCGFTLSGERPASPLTISMAGTITSGSFTSGPTEVTWTANGVVTAQAPPPDRGWSFSADAYPSRNGPGWAVSIGAVTAEGDNVIPSTVTCELRSSTGFAPTNGPVGYWAGFASR